jgi:Predicted membrane protein involved in D-alanine export
MQLNSAIFLVFLAITAGIYYLLPKRYQSPFLLLASYVFYIWAAPLYSLLLLFSTTLSYFAAKAISLAKIQKMRRAFMIWGIVFHLLVLCLFKYYSFFTEVPSVALGIFPKDEGAFSLILPIGISFYTFQIIGYLVDVYNKKTEHETNFLTYALFLSFFPTVFSGPIARAGEMLPQYKLEHRFDYSGLVEGLQRFLTGALKKVVIADGLGIIVNGIFEKTVLRKAGGITLVIAVVLYSIELYFDFAGYTDMAAGVAKIFGFKLRENFQAPYLATNFSGFWGRWHMSLTLWFRDYLYFPLGGNRKGFARKLLNIGIVFLLSGLWHGSTINFVIWGAFNGLLRIGEELVHKKMGPQKNRDGTALGFVVRWLKRIGVVSMWTFSLIFFRSNSFSDAIYIITNIPRAVPLGPAAEQLLDIIANGVGDTGIYYLMFFVVLLFALVMASIFDRRIYCNQTSFNPLCSYKKKTRWLLYWLFGFAVVIFYFLALTGESGVQSFAYENF